MMHNTTLITCTECGARTLTYKEDKISGCLKIYCPACAKRRGY